MTQNKPKMKNYYPQEDEDRLTPIGIKPPKDKFQMYETKIDTKNIVKTNFGKSEKYYSHPFDRELYNQPVKRAGWFTRFIRRWFTENCEECNQELLQVGYNGKKKCFNRYCPMFDKVI
jgi:hypothetical protein